jgi:hypothetical protein
MAEVYKVHPGMKRSIFSRLSITFWLIGINVLAFIIFSIVIGINPDAIKFIAIQPANVLSGYVWTFLTSMFMHGGFFHLFANMVTLFFVGVLIERLLGPKRYVYFYLAAGIFAGLLFVISGILLPSETNQYAVGASGAIFGLLGLLMLLTPDLPVYIFFIPIPVKMKYAVPGILVLLWIISAAANVPIGNVAHLGGFLFGIGYGSFLKRKYRRKTQMIIRHFS